MVILNRSPPNNAIQSFSGAKDSSLGRFLYLWSLHLVVNIVKTMFKWIFLSLIFIPCCKYTHSKNNVKLLQLTSSKLHQELLNLNRVVCCLKLLFYFGITFAVRVELEVVVDSTTIFDNFSCKIFHRSAI